MYSIHSLISENFVRFNIPLTILKHYDEPQDRTPDTNEFKICYVNGDRKVLKYVKATQRWCNVFDSPWISYKNEDVSV